MNEFTQPSEMENLNAEEMRKFKRSRNPKWVGLFLLVIGAVLLAKQLGVLFPVWFFTWPVLLIAIGLLIGFQHNFHNRGWVFPVLIGAVFLFDELTPGLNLKNFLWPIIIIALGLLFIFRPKTNRHWERWNRNRWEEKQSWAENYDLPASGDPNDFIDSTCIFSGIKKIILSKNFRGGDITNFMGGTEINLTQADINGRITIDATNIFGGTKLIIPPTWDVQSSVVSIFGGVDDKRQLTGAAINSDKVIHLDGTCLFGGIEIKNF